MEKVHEHVSGIVRIVTAFLAFMHRDPLLPYWNTTNVRSMELQGLRVAAAAADLGGLF